MENELPSHNEAIVSLFDQELRWWTEVYREDLPRGFFSFEMRRRLDLVADRLAIQIKAMVNPEVLECGCGPGDILRLLAPLQCTLTGLDLNPRYLELAAEKVPGAILVDGNIEELPFPDASFDIVYAIGVLQYLNDDHLALKEIRRVTKEGGFVMISVPNYRMLHLLLDPYYIFRFFAKLFDLHKELKKPEFNSSMLRRYTKAHLRRLFSYYDLKPIEELSTSYGPLKFWRREILSVSLSIRISEFIRGLSQIRFFTCLNRVGNHWIITLCKDSSPTDSQTQR